MSGRRFTRSVVAVIGFAVIALVLGSGWRTPASDEPKAEPKAAPKRKPWTTSKITGSPEPPPKFKSVRVFPDVKFNHPLLIARCPGTDRLFIGEQEGTIFSVTGGGGKKEPFLDLKKDFKTLIPNPKAQSIGELYGLVFHPKFEQNRTCYVCYTLNAKEGQPRHLPDGTRVSRFTVTKTDPPRIDVASEEIVITFQGGGHNGGDLHFGPDGMLYISTGDGSGPNPPDQLNTGQDCTDLLSSILRIDVEKKDANKNYAVPKDNPFVGVKDVRPEIWAFGFRNPWRMSFDRQTGDLWVGDVGWELWEMVHKIQKGGNYGWSIVEGRQPIKPTQKIGPAPILAPTIELPHTIACSVTGGYVYRGKKFPELVGAYIFGDWETRRIWATRFENGRVKEMPEIVKPNIRVSAFGEDNAGEIYYAEYDTGVIYTLSRNEGIGANTKFPKTLSETGLFKDVAKYEMAEGVRGYSVNVPQWQDGATAFHHIALPDMSRVTIFSEPKPLPGQVFWHNFRMQFPKDTVLEKTISVPLPVAGFKSRRVETQILHFDGEDWRGYTYAWRDDQSDADLVPPDGEERTVLTKATRGSGKREQVWTFHSRNQCIVCHNAWAEYALAFSIVQLNTAPLRTERSGRSQLVWLSQQGYIERRDKDNKELPPFDLASAKSEPALLGNDFVQAAKNPEPYARSYLHANCAHCHRFGGGGGQVVLELDYSKPLKETGILDVKPRQGDFGITDARIIAPGDPARSVLLYRMAKFGRGRMPHMGSEWPDSLAMTLMDRWICSLGGKGPTLMPRNTDNVENALRSVNGAYPFALAVDGYGFSVKGYRQPILAAAAKLPPGPVRDLFEGYLPPDPKGRKLGNNPRPAAILALTGDAAKGAAIFFNKEMKCANCHKIGDKGLSVGPELTAIGKTRTRVELLESVLQPSVRVEAQFATYNVRTKDEKAVTGLLVKRDDKQIVVRDAENKEHTFAAADVESVTPSRLSLMPDGLVAGLTPQEAADLLEFLVQRKGP